MVNIGVVTNGGQSNHILMNQEFGTFLDVVPLPFMKTSSRSLGFVSKQTCDDTKSTSIA
jgi:hypothetical protein